MVYKIYAFEFDPEKSQSNKLKHEIDFEEAKALWDDPSLIEIEAKTVDERRYLMIGRIEGNYWSAVITYRQERIRLISVRRSRFSEVKIYEESQSRRF